MLTFSNDTEFFESTRKWRYVRDLARATRTAPWGVAGCLLARVSAVTPANVVVPAFVGGRPSSLNCFVAVVGGSGDGKGLAEGVARLLVPDLLGAAVSAPASGEGLATLFAAREQRKDDNGDNTGSVLTCINQRALLSVPEISTLTAAMSRVGSTLTGTLTSLWSGEQLANQNVSEAKRLRVPELGYRLALVTGVQPSNADGLLREDGTGLPQRVLWVTTADPDAPKEHPAPPAGNFGFDVRKLEALQPSQFDLNGLYAAGSVWNYKAENGTPNYRLHELTYPDCVKAEIDADALRRLHRTRPAGLDAHALLVRIRVAGLLAIMEQREGRELEVTEGDWARAGYIVKRSREFREQCISDGRATHRSKRRDALADEITAKNEAEEIAMHRRFSARVATALQRGDPKREGMKGYMIQKRTGLPTGDVYDTLARMFTEGRVEKVGPEADKPSGQLWTLALARTQVLALDR